MYVNLDGGHYGGGRGGGYYPGGHGGYYPGGHGGYYDRKDYYWYWRGYIFRLQTNQGLLRLPTVNYQQNLFIVCELYNKMLVMQYLLYFDFNISDQTCSRSYINEITNYKEHSYVYMKGDNLSAMATSFLDKT